MGSSRGLSHYLLFKLISYEDPVILWEPRPITRSGHKFCDRYSNGDSAVLCCRHGADAADYQTDSGERCRQRHLSANLSDVLRRVVEREFGLNWHESETREELSRRELLVSHEEQTDTSQKCISTCVLNARAISVGLERANALLDDSNGDPNIVLCERCPSTSMCQDSLFVLAGKASQRRLCSSSLVGKAAE